MLPAHRNVRGAGGPLDSARHYRNDVEAFLRGGEWAGMQQNQVESNRINLETYFGGPNPFWLDLRGGRIQKNPKESILN